MEKAFQDIIDFQDIIEHSKKLIESLKTTNINF